MKQMSCAAAAVAPHLEGRAAASHSRLGVVPLVLVLLTAFAGLYAVSMGVSRVLVQSLGVAVLLALGVPLTVGVLRRPETLARPIHVFLLGCIYFLVLDMAFLREVEEFSPETILIAETIIIAFIVATLGTWYLAPLRHTPWTAALKRVDRNLTGNAYFWIALIAFSLEYLRRLFLVGWSFSDLVHELLLSKTGGAFRRDVAGDWRVFLLPAELLFRGVTVFADRAWERGISQVRKLMLLIVVGLQLGTFVLDGTRGTLLTVMVLPLFVRSAQFNRGVNQWLRAFVLASFLLAPVMDLMVGVRGYGWSRVSQVEQVNWNIVEAHRDDNFFWVANLVDFLRQDRGVLAYKGPLGFIEGMKEISWQWLIAPIPRVFWPDKPLATDIGDETKRWNATNSIVGGLLRSGGLTLVIFGGVLFGLWLNLLEPLYQSPKNDGAAIVYAFLLLVTLSAIRSAFPWNTLPLLLTVALIVIAWRAVGFLQRQMSPQPALRSDIWR